jgi:hypothetical protein
MGEYRLGPITTVRILDTGLTSLNPVMSAKVETYLYSLLAIKIGIHTAFKDYKEVMDLYAARIFLEIQ